MMLACALRARASLRALVLDDRMNAALDDQEASSLAAIFGLQVAPAAIAANTAASLDPTR